MLFWFRHVQTTTKWISLVLGDACACQLEICIWHSLHVTHVLRRSARTAQVWSMYEFLSRVTCIAPSQDPVCSQGATCSASEPSGQCAKPCELFRFVQILDSKGSMHGCIYLINHAVDVLMRMRFVCQSCTWELSSAMIQRHFSNLVMIKAACAHTRAAGVLNEYTPSIPLSHVHALADYTKDANMHWSIRCLTCSLA